MYALLSTTLFLALAYAVFFAFSLAGWPVALGFLAGYFTAHISNAADGATR